MTEYLRFDKEETTFYLINPNPAITEGLRVGIRNDGSVGFWVIGDATKGFCLSPEAAIALADLIKIKC